MWDLLKEKYFHKSFRLPRFRCSKPFIAKNDRDNISAVKYYANKKRNLIPKVSTWAEQAEHSLYC